MKVVAFLLVAYCVAVLGQTGIGRRELGDSCCGLDGFYSDEKVCCSGRLFALRDNFECCGTNYYDASDETKICCNGVVNTISPASSIPNAACCGTRWYDTTQRECCGDNIFSPPSTKTIDDVVCCLDVGVYDPDEAICCVAFGSIIRLPANSNPANFACCSRSTAFDVTTQTCCSGVVSNNQNFACCGSRAYDPTEQLCCAGNKLLNFKEGQECCGSNLFNTTSHVCCNGTIHQFEAVEFTCCGNRYFDPRFDTCCDNSYVLKGTLNDLPTRACCGQELYDTAQQVCCNKKVGCGNFCCNEHGYHTETRTCCAGNLVYGEFACCGNKHYDPTVHICCGTNLFKLEDGFNACCGDAAYDNTVATCCERVVNNRTQFSVVNGVGLCCFGSSSVAVYDPDHEVCCDGVVECGDACCGRNGYFTQIQSCSCNNVVVPTPNLSFNCCGIKEFDPATQTCCIDVIFETLANGECCGRQYVNRDTEVCCPSA